MSLLIEEITKNHWFGCIFAPLILLIHSFSSFYIPAELQSIGPLIPALKSNWLIMHVSVMIFSYAALVCGSILSIGFVCLYQLRQSQSVQNLIWQTQVSVPTHQSKTSALLEKLDNTSYRIIGFGFPFLTIGILSGAIWANEAWGSYWSWDPKETWALITWLTFAIYLHTRYIYQWSGIKSSILGSVGFVVIWICYMGVNLIGKGLHSYGFFN